MSITVGDHTFDGPFADTVCLRDSPGVFAIHCYASHAYQLLDVGESANIRQRVDHHERRDSWRQTCSGRLMYSALYTPGVAQAGRVEFEREIRQLFNPPCGER